jgi:glycosyltransferase involved in cell wall biosynthesis
MRIAFLVIGNGRRSNYLNGYNLRYGGGGGSGTDTSSVLVAEYLAKQGHEVVFVTDKLEEALKKDYEEKGRVYTPGEEFYGVKYTNIEFDGIENLEFDILVSMLWFQDYDKLPIKISKSLIYWSHMQWIYGVGELLNFVRKNNLSLGFVHISEWEKQMNINTVSHLVNNNQEINVKSTIIPNPIMDEIINETINSEPLRKPHKFIFHASWARGGDVAMNAIRELEIDDKEFHAFDYLITIADNKDTFFHRHQGVDKKTLFKHLAESEYFIYPLYTPYQDVHKDTFSCVVAEAIALGTIVVTYPLGALPENFGDFCQWLDFPEGVDYEKMQNESLTKDLDGKFKITSNIVDKINFLEQNPHIKEEIRKKGTNYILSNFNSDKIGKMWDNLIESLI